MAALRPFSWIEPSFVLANPTSGKVDTFRDLVQTEKGARATTYAHAWTQSTAARQVASPKESSVAHGRRVALFTGAQAYQSNAPAADWKFLHSGTGAEIYFAFVYRSGGTTNLLHAGVNTANEAGLSVYFTNTGQIGVIVYNGSGVAGYDTGAVAAGMSAGTAYTLTVRHATASTPDVDVLLNGSSIASGNVTSPSSGNPPFAPYLGSTSTFALFANMDLACACYFNRTLTATERAVASSYMSQFV